MRRDTGQSYQEFLTRLAKASGIETPTREDLAHAVDVETGAIVAVTLQGADQGDTTTIVETATAAAEQVEDAQADVEEPQALEEIVALIGIVGQRTVAFWRSPRVIADMRGSLASSTQAHRQAINNGYLRHGLLSPKP